MDETQKIRTGRHCMFAMHVHLVFVTKFRHSVFTDAHLRRMERIMRSVCGDFECELVEFNGEDNHVHLLVNFPPKVAVTKLVNSLKGVSSLRLRQEYPDLVRHYWRANELWSGSYFAGTVGGAPLRGQAVHRAAEPAGVSLTRLRREQPRNAARRRRHTSVRLRRTRCGDAPRHTGRFAFPPA